MSDRDIEAMKKLYDEQVRKGVSRATRTHTFRSAECNHNLHRACAGQCRYCEAQCDCPCHTGG